MRAYFARSCEQGSVLRALWTYFCACKRESFGFSEIIHIILSLQTRMPAGRYGQGAGKWVGKLLMCIQGK